MKPRKAPLALVLCSRREDSPGGGTLVKISLSLSLYIYIKYIIYHIPRPKRSQICFSRARRPLQETLFLINVSSLAYRPKPEVCGWMSCGLWPYCLQSLRAKKCESGEFRNA